MKLLRFLRTSTPETLLGGRYKLIGQLGAGGFGQTFLAEDCHLPGRPRCVIKQLKPQFSSSNGLRTAKRLFDTEANVLYQLGNHDQIPRLLAHFEQDNEFYLAQELIVGEPLAQELVNGQRWTEEQVVNLLHDILHVLVFVHQQGVIHRDIKPQNLIRRRHDNRIVLIDFGAVKQASVQLADPNSGPTRTISIGTQGYMPNEQIAGNPRFSSDIYAVGKIGIQALVGMSPRHLQDDPQTGEVIWRHLAPQASAELADFLDQMVRYDFRARYATASDALAAMQNLPIQPIPLPPPSIHPQPISDFPDETVAPTAGLSQQALGQHALSHPHSVTIDPDLAKQTTAPWQTPPDLPDSLASSSNLPNSNTPNSNAPSSNAPGAASPDSSLRESRVSTYALVPPSPPATSNSMPGWAFLQQHISQPKPQYVLPLAGVVAVAGFLALVNSFAPPQSSDPTPEPAPIASSAPSSSAESTPSAEPSPSAPSPNPAAQAKTLIDQADQLREEGQFQQALALYDEAIALNSNVAEAQWGRCYSLNRLSNPAEAIAACDAALALNPNYPEALWSKGYALDAQQQFQAALGFYNQAIALKPDFAEAWSNKGTVLFKLGRPSEALTALDRATNLDPTLVEAWNSRGAALWNLQRFDEAVASVDRALQLQPDYQDALSLRAEMRQRLGR